MVVFRVHLVGPFSLDLKHEEVSVGRHGTFILPRLIPLGTLLGRGESSGQRAICCQGHVPRGRLASWGAAHAVVWAPCSEEPQLGLVLCGHCLAIVWQILKEAHTPAWAFCTGPCRWCSQSCPWEGALLLISLMMQMKNDKFWPWPRLLRRRNL